MGFAIIRADGSIKRTGLKLTGYDKILQGERIVKHTYPLVDETLYTVTPVLPVEGDEVVYSVVYKEEAADIELNRNLVKVDADVDEIYSLAIGSRGPEYIQAELEAKLFEQNNFQGTPPPYVASWVAATGWTAQAAAQDMLEQAAAWRAAATLIREKRLKAKADLRAGVPTAMLVWAGFVSVIKAQLGVQ